MLFGKAVLALPNNTWANNALLPIYTTKMKTLPRDTDGYASFFISTEWQNYIYIAIFQAL